MSSWKNSIERRKFLASMGIGAATLPFLETVLGRKIAHAQPPKQLKRLIILAQSHMSLGYHRIPEFCTGAYGNADTSILKTDTALGLRVGAFPSDPSKLGTFYGQGSLKTSPRMQKEMMVVNGLAPTYSSATGHLSDGNGSWSAGGQGGKFNPRSRYPLSGSVHQPMVTIDHVIAKKIHTSGQRIMFMGDSKWGAGGADTDESIDAAGVIQSLSRDPRTIYAGSIFDNGAKVTAAQMRAGGGTPTPVPTDPLASASTADFAALTGLEYSQEERKRLLANKSLSASDKLALEQYYDLLNESLKTRKAGLSTGGGTPGVAVSSECKPPTLGNGDLAGFLRLIGTAFLCDLSRVAFISLGSYWDHNTVWHAHADGNNTSNLSIFNQLAAQVAQAADFVLGLRDPATGSDMLESTLILGITNNSMALRTDGRDTSHSFGDYSYFSVGGSAALNTGFMYDALAVNGGKRPAVGGPVPTVNQYLQTIAAAFGLTSADWSPAGGKGFGPWMSSTWSGRPLRADDTAKTSPIPGLLKTT